MHCAMVSMHQLYYTTRLLLDENGITVKDNMTMDEFIALSKEIEEKPVTRPTFATTRTSSS